MSDATRKSPCFNPLLYRKTWLLEQKSLLVVFYSIKYLPINTHATSEEYLANTYNYQLTWNSYPVCDYDSRWLAIIRKSTCVNSPRERYRCQSPSTLLEQESSIYVADMAARFECQVDEVVALNY